MSAIIIILINSNWLECIDRQFSDNNKGTWQQKNFLIYLKLYMTRQNWLKKRTKLLSQLTLKYRYLDDKKIIKGQYMTAVRIELKQ